MATAAADPVFVDTNVLVFSRVALSPLHNAAVTKLHSLATGGHPLWISRQILREYLAAMSKPGTLTVPVPMTTLIADVQSFQARFAIGEDGPTVTSELLSLLGAVVCAGKQIHDANVVATMRAHGLPNLLTHNVADFARFASYISIMPLV